MPAYSVGVNRSHRSENLKIEYYACLDMKSQLLFLVKGLAISVHIATVRPLPYPSGENHYSPSGENHYQL